MEGSLRDLYLLITQEGVSVFWLQDLKNTGWVETWVSLSWKLST